MTISINKPDFYSSYQHMKCALTTILPDVLQKIIHKFIPEWSVVLCTASKINKFFSSLKTLGTQQTILNRKLATAIDFPNFDTEWNGYSMVDNAF